MPDRRSKIFVTYASLESGTCSAQVLHSVIQNPLSPVPQISQEPSHDWGQNSHTSCILQPTTCTSALGQNISTNPLHLARRPQRLNKARFAKRDKTYVRAEGYLQGEDVFGLRGWGGLGECMQAPAAGCRGGPRLLLHCPAGRNCLPNHIQL